MLSSDQIRAARALLRWDQARLAAASEVSIETVKRLEKLDGSLGGTRISTVDAIRRALEDAGIQFIPENGGGAGVRLRSPHSKDRTEHKGPATDAVRAMDAAIEEHRKNKS